MKRRTAIKNLSALAAGMALFPSCSDSLRLNIAPDQILSFSDNQSIWIEAISDAILPKQDLSLSTFESFPSFLSKMMVFQKPKEDQKSFINGYNMCTSEVKKLYDNSPKKISPEQIIEFFSSILGSDKKSVEDLAEQQRITDKKYFCNQIRTMSIWHLTTSKEYQEDVLEYKLVPDSFEACVEE